MKLLIDMPDNATNGDMIKLMFPSINVNEEWKATRHGDILSEDGKIVELALSATSDWWDARYIKKEDSSETGN